MPLSDTPISTPKILLCRRTHGTADLTEALSEIKDLGFDGMELALPYLGVVFGGRIIQSELTRLVKNIQAADTYTTLHAPLSLNFLDAEHISAHVAVARSTVEVAGAIGAPVVVLHPGWVPPAILADNRESLMAQELNYLEALADHAQSCGTRIALENMPELPPKLAAERSTYGLIPADIAKQAAALDHPALTTCLDLSHAAISASAFGTDLRQDAHSMAPHIGHIHLHDSFARPGTLFNWTPEENLTFGYGDTHLPLGWGNLDINGVLDGLPVEANTAITLEILDHLQTPHALTDSLTRARTAAAKLTVNSIKVN